MYRSPYREQKLPRHLTIPQFVLRHLDNATEHAELLFPSPFGSRAQCKPLALCDVRSGAYALAARLASADLPGGALARGDAVLFLTENQHDYLMMCLGVMLAGGIPALLNPQYRGEELRAIVQKVCPRLVFASEATYQEAEKALAGERSGHGPRVYVFEEHHAQSLHTHLLAPGRQVRGFCEVPVNPVEDTAMYCFSSGTSGTPKIVCLSHFNLVANVIQTVATLGGRMNVPRFDDAHWYDQPLLPPQNGTNQFHLSILPQFHCYGMLMAVASLHTATPSVIFARFHVDQFFEAVQQFRVTFAFVVPPILLALATSPLASRYDLSSVQSFASGAATLSKELCQMVYEKKGIPVTDGYGMTEMSPLIALQTTADIARRHLDVGRLVPNTEARVVDVNTGQDVHPGERGELWLRGPQMMLGYRNNDEANAQAFVPSSHAPDRFFKSGDIVSISNEGYICIHDRIKDIIKYNGYQVPASELEELASRSDVVLDVAVVGKVQKNNLARNELPWAFVVANEHGKTMSEEVRTNAVLEQVNTRVAPYKKLRGVTWIDRIPKSYVMSAPHTQCCRKSA